MGMVEKKRSGFIMYACLLEIICLEASGRGSKEAGARPK
jgi:hypothetical protein